MLCTGDHAAQPSPVRVGLSAGVLATSLRFDGGRTAELREQAYALSVEMRLSPEVGLVVSPGGVLGGTMKLAGTTYTLGPGPLLGVGVTWRVIDPAKNPYFLLFGASLSGSRSSTAAGREHAALTAFDARASLIVGTTIASRVSPYAAVRAFGGPVFWKLAGTSVTGTDAYHYHVGAGVSVALPGSIDLFVEGAPLGERRLTAGLGATF